MNHRPLTFLIGVAFLTLFLVTSAQVSAVQAQATVDAATGNWTTTSPLPQAFGHTPAVVYNHTVYLAGGEGPPGNLRTTIYRGAVFDDGSIPGWVASRSLPQPRHYHAMVVGANGYLYVIGGFTTGGLLTQNTISYAKINNMSELDPWNTANLPTPLGSPMAVIAGARLYVLGGYNGASSQKTVYYTTLSADGSLGSWATTTALPQGLSWSGAVVANGRIYVAGGATAGGWTAATYSAVINANGTLGSWNTLSSLPKALGNHVFTRNGNALYVIGGFDGSASQKSVYTAPLQTDGSLGNWIATTDLPQPLHDQAGLFYSNLYIFGGFNTTVGIYQSTVYMNAFPFSCDIQPDIPKSECDALVTLYNNTNGPNWKFHRGWLVTNAPCSWDGIACYDGHVIDLDLHLNQLSGSIPAQLANLTYLDTLSLSENQLSGPIPPELGTLTKLVWLSLDTNQLSGGIPPQLGNLVNLHDLYLQINQLSGNVPSELGQLANLQRLQIDNTQLSGALPSSFTNLKQLQWFFFDQTNLCEPADATFQAWLSGISTLHRTNQRCTTAQADLVPYQGAGWEFPVVPSSVQGTTTSNTLYAGQPTYFDWGVKNQGNAVTGASFYVDLFIDGTQFVHYPFNSDPGSGIPFLDWNQTVDTPGWHTVKIIVDNGNAINESDETNNTWEHQFYWQPVTPTCYTLTTNINPDGGGTVSTTPSPNCQGNQYTQGTVVSVSATANTGYGFSQWTGAASGNANPLAVTMDGNKSITANFTQASSLIAYYPFDGDLTDHSGNHHDGSAQGNIPFVPGAAGQAASFSGATWMFVDNPLLPVGNAARSLCLWAKSADGKRNGNADHLANWGTAAAGQAFGLMIFTGDTWWGYGHEFQTYDTDSGVKADTNWHFLCVTYDSAKMQVYVDGALRNERTMTLNTTGTTFYVGVRPDRASGNTYDGLIDEVRIYNKALSAQEIADLYTPICITAAGSQGGPVCPVPIEPVIFLNGMAGSELRLTDDHSVIWPSLRTISKMPLSLKPGDPNHVYVSDAIRHFEVTYHGVTVTDPAIYASFINRLTAQGKDGGGYTEYMAGSSPHTHCDPNQQPTATLYVYAWDWRYGVASVIDGQYNPSVEQMTALKSYLDCVLQQHPGQKINLVAHSMGGMYSLLFLLKNQGYPIDNIITMGTPWLGAPKAIYMMLNGDFMAPLLPASETRALLQYFPGAHQLLPAAVYDTHAPIRVLSILDTTDLNAPVHHDVPIAYQDLQATLQKQYTPQSTIPFVENNKVVFDMPGFTDWNRASSSVQFHVLYGLRWSDDTVIQTKQAIHKGYCYAAPPPYGMVCAPPSIDFDPVMGYGDGTVPIASAGWPGQSTHSFNVHVHPFANQTPQDEQQESFAHKDLPDNIRIQNCVLSILQPSKGYTCKDDGSAETNVAALLMAAQPRHIVIRGASFISVTDGITLSGNLLESGEFLPAFPGLSVAHISFDSVHIVIPSNAPYSITVKPGNQGILIDNKLGLDVQPVEIRRYDGLSNVPTDAFIMTNGVNNTTQLTQDMNHDGKGDVLITPSAVVTGSAILDTQPPAVVIKYDGNNKIVTVSAIDEQSGISRIFYSFDGLNYLLYQQPVVIAPGVSKIYAEAEDKVGNMSNVKTLDITSPLPFHGSVYLPIVSR